MFIDVPLNVNAPNEFEINKRGAIKFCAALHHKGCKYKN